MQFKNIFFTALAVFLFGVIAIEVFSSFTEKKAKSDRLSCHEEVVVFERIYHEDLIDKVQQAIIANDYELQVRVSKSSYMPTQLFDHITPQQIAQMLQDRYSKEYDAQAASSKSAVIDLFIYENDKEDPKKKNEAAKKYAGYLTLRYMIDEKEIYRFQIDFMDMQARDIDTRIDCAVKSLMSL